MSFCMPRFVVSDLLIPEKPLVAAELLYLMGSDGLTKPNVFAETSPQSFLSNNSATISWLANWDAAEWGRRPSDAHGVAANVVARFMLRCGQNIAVIEYSA